MKKRGLVTVIIILLAIVVLSLVFLPKTGYSIQTDEKISLDELRLQAQVQCLQNFQCDNGYECVDNLCVESKVVDLCQKVSLSTDVRELKSGKPINSAKRVLTRSDLPYLLSDGEIDEIINGNLTKHLYTPAILIGDNMIREENEKYTIKAEENKPLFTYRLYFSKPVDFSNENIQGQTLRILGKEYVVGDKSDNKEIFLSSGTESISFKNNENLNLVSDKSGKVYLIDIPVYLSDDLQVASKQSDDVFNAVGISFNYADDKNTEITFGGIC